MKQIFLIAMLLSLAACTPADVEYCSKFGVAGTPEYGNCLNYYEQQQAAFRADYNVCAVEADATYPPYLYDYGRYAHTVGGFGGLDGRFYGGHSIRIEPDYRRNAEIDYLRNRIIEPCMQARGWNSGRSWQAGRHAVKKPTARKMPQPSGEPLPWIEPRRNSRSQAETLPWLR